MISKPPQIIQYLFTQANVHMVSQDGIISRDMNNNSTNNNNNDIIYIVSYLLSCQSPVTS